MRYMLLMYAQESAIQSATPEEFQAANRAWQALAK